MSNPPLKLHILSDLHLEFSAFEPPHTDADVVVLAGDIGRSTSGLDWARNAFPRQAIVYVPGNHEYYRAQRPQMLAALRRAAQECRVHLLDEDQVVIHTHEAQPPVRFLGCT